MSDRRPELPNRQIPFSEAFRKFIVQGWAPDPKDLPDQLPAAVPAQQRRERVSAQFPGERLVIPAGGLKVRSNDTDYRFRPNSAFAHLTGLGTDREPDAVLVLEPTDSGHDATLYFRPRAPRDSEEFYADSRFGELWVGRRASLEEMSSLCGIPCASISDLGDHLKKNSDTIPLRVLPAELEPEIQNLIEEIRSPRQNVKDDQEEPATVSADHELAMALSELRLIKDGFETTEMREACRQTALAFEAVVAGIPEAVRGGRGERWIEGIVAVHARHIGNAVGYDTIAAAGDHACTLHWIRNDGALQEGELLLLDAGIELDSLYTADVTRTLPIGGTFTDDQRRIYDAVYAAQQAGIAAARPGARFSDVHKAAIAVIAQHLHDWGLLPVSVAETLGEEGGQHRRWMVHGTSHHLGIDVHDCAQARIESYREGVLLPGMIMTVEPGLYFKPDDELVPEPLRGIGVRIEDDILITSTGNENLTAMLPQPATTLKLGCRESGRPGTKTLRRLAMTTAPQRRYLPGIKSLNRRPASNVIPIPSPPPSSIIAWAWYVNGVRKPAENLGVAAHLANAGEGFVWLGLKDPKDADLMALASEFDLHPLAIEDAVHGHTRSKLEMFGDDLFMVISTVAYVEHEELTDTSEVVATGQVMVFLGDHFVITVRRGEHAQLSSLRRTMEADPERLARGPSEVLYAIADKIIDDYLEVVAEFEKDVDEIESLVFARSGKREVERVYQLKRELIEFKRCVMPLGAPLLRLATRELPVIPPEAKAYFRELADHHTEAREAVASFDEVLSSILQAGLARASVADNEDMRKISAWVAIVVVPTMVAGIYGMNFDNMPELHWRYGYFIVLGAILLIMITLYFGFKRNRWL